ncbi:MAG: hypothetical protein LBS74_08425 [Oscillospiraceae bacterium]|nr:hypothetical protein [Oscillospiraceae bacterium]
MLDEQTMQAMATKRTPIALRCEYCGQTNTYGATDCSQCSAPLTYDEQHTIYQELFDRDKYEIIKADAEYKASSAQKGRKNLIILFALPFIAVIIISLFWSIGGLFSGSSTASTPAQVILTDTARADELEQTQIEQAYYSNDEHSVTFSAIGKFYLTSLKKQEDADGEEGKVSYKASFRFQRVSPNNLTPINRLIVNYSYQTLDNSGAPVRLRDSFQVESMEPNSVYEVTIKGPNSVSSVIIESVSLQKEAGTQW